MNRHVLSEVCLRTPSLRGSSGRLALASMGALLFAGCACSSVIPPLVYTPQPPSRASWVPEPPEASYAALAASWHPRVQLLHEAASKIVISDDFRTWLEQIEKLSPTPGQPLLSGADVAGKYLAPSAVPGGLRRLPICYRTSGAGNDVPAVTDWKADEQCAEGGSMVAVITLRKPTTDRLEQAHLEASACVINTLAHEWAHAITSEQDDSLVGIFNDTGHGKRKFATVSYTVGAFAQCLYLRSARKEPSFDVAGCVQAVGTSEFYYNTCAKGWSKRFAPQPVATAMLPVQP